MPEETALIEGNKQHFAANFFIKHKYFFIWGLFYGYEGECRKY